MQPAQPDPCEDQEQASSGSTTPRIGITWAAASTNPPARHWPATPRLSWRTTDHAVHRDVVGRDALADGLADNSRDLDAAAPPVDGLEHPVEQRRVS
jgi:hypothetical protein